MKKIVLFFTLILALHGNTSFALSLKKRISNLEEKIALLAHTEEKSWKEMKKLNKHMEKLETMAMEKEKQRDREQFIEQVRVISPENL